VRAALVDHRPEKSGLDYVPARLFLVGPPDANIDQASPGRGIP